MQKNSEKRSKRNIGTITLMKESKKTLVNVEYELYSLMMGNPLGMGLPPILWNNFSEMITRSLSGRAYCQWNKRSVIAQKMKRQRNVCGIYHPRCYTSIRNGWKLVPYWQSINMQCLHQWRIYIKHQKCSWKTISMCPLKYRSNLHQQNWQSPWIIKYCLV